MSDFFQLSRQAVCHGVKKICCALATLSWSCGRLGRDKRSLRALLSIRGLTSETRIQPRPLWWNPALQGIAGKGFSQPL